MAGGVAAALPALAARLAPADMAAALLRFKGSRASARRLARQIPRRRLNLPLRRITAGNAMELCGGRLLVGYSASQQSTGPATTCAWLTGVMEYCTAKVASSAVAAMAMAMAMRMLIVAMRMLVMCCPTHLVAEGGTLPPGRSSHRTWSNCYYIALQDTRAA